MRRGFFYGALAALTALPTSQGLNILLGNDDGWAAANIREFYRLLKKSGHDVLLLAPVVDNSGQGGRSVFTTSPTLLSDAQYGSAAVGASSVGSDPADNHIWYYNGTPAACTFVGLDYVVPKVFPGKKVDLFVSGPNVGQNLGPFLYTLSGTIGSTYAAVGRGVPGIAFSAGSVGGQRGYKNINATTPTGYPDPATIYAQLSVNLVNQIAKNAKRGSPLFPAGYGLNVNYPTITSFQNTSCIKPDFVQTRLTGGAFSDQAVFNASSKIFTFQNILGGGINACINGDCSLPGETTVVNSGCHSSVSVFTVDYDAPVGKQTTQVRQSLEPLVKYQKKNHARASRNEEREAVNPVGSGPWRHE